jgi:hypothetical protein
MAQPPALIRDRSAERERMIAAQVAGRGVTDTRVLEAMRQVPREAFVRLGMEEFAYEHSPLPIAEGQTISQPYIVALMAEAAPHRHCPHRLFSSLRSSGSGLVLITSLAKSHPRRA